MFQTVDAAQLKALLEGDDRPLLLDVRTAGEFARGTIAGAQSREFGTPTAKAEAFDPRAPVALSCQSGARSAQGCAWLEHDGLKAMHDLARALAGWMRTGLPLAS